MAGAAVEKGPGAGVAEGSGKVEGDVEPEANGSGVEDCAATSNEGTAAAAEGSSGGVPPGAQPPSKSANATAHSGNKTACRRLGGIVARKVFINLPSMLVNLQRRYPQE